LRQRSAQRMERRIDEGASSTVAGKLVHSSNDMVMSESSRRWISIERSGVRRCCEPSYGRAEGDAVSIELAQLLSDITWKPP
jgi:hypothetical protein